MTVTQQVEYLHSRAELFVAHRALLDVMFSTEDEAGACIKNVLDEDKYEFLLDMSTELFIKILEM